MAQPMVWCLMRCQEFTLKSIRVVLATFSSLSAASADIMRVNWCWSFNIAWFVFTSIPLENNWNRVDPDFQTKFHPIIRWIRTLPFSGWHKPTWARLRSVSAPFGLQCLSLSHWFVVGVLPSLIWNRSTSRISGDLFYWLIIARSSVRSSMTFSYRIFIAFDFWSFSANFLKAIIAINSFFE